MGEGFHNYHHTFPYDYSTSEWGFRLNVTTRLVQIEERRAEAGVNKVIPAVTKMMGNLKF